MSRSSNSRVKPAWLEGLMAETFFGGCGVHENQRKNEKNVFCLHCCLSICLHCLPSHPSHSMLQVRRYVYNDVIRLGDLEKLIDCSYIQPYTINGAKVIFLNQRHQTRSCKGSSNICYTCDRILQEPFHFCSLSCKVDRLAFQGENLSSILHRFDESNFPIFQFKGLRMDGLEVIDDERQVTTSSVIKKHVASSCPNETTSSSLVSKEQIVVKKNSGFLSRIGLSLGNRRKGAPQRAPLS